MEGLGPLDQNKIFMQIHIFRSYGEGYDGIIVENHEEFKVLSTSQEIFYSVADRLHMQWFKCIYSLVVGENVFM